MVGPILLRRPPPSSAARLCISAFHNWRSYATTETFHEDREKRGEKWFTLPPFTATINGSALGKELSRNRSYGRDVITSTTSTTTTALKWVTRCCPELPRSLVQKLFRLRQVRRESCDMECSGEGVEALERPLKRVAAKDSMNVGDRIHLPISVQEFPNDKQELPNDKKECHCSEEEVTFIRSLELYKDPAIIVINKPPGMPVQGGIGIKRSLDELAAACLSYDFSEPPRLVHRLDRDSSGILVMGRTQTSATVLHSIFREKTFGASNDVVVDNGKSDRITIVNNSQTLPSQHAITKYKVIGSPCPGYTWLELTPLTGRKHQLRVHCAEVLRTPIVGDYKYGWQTHRNWKPLAWSNNECHSDEEFPKRKNLPFDLNMESGSVSEKNPRLHLHCKQMVLPNVNLALQNVKLHSDSDLSELESLELVAPLPSFMQRSWNITNS
ncbi:RNA pseudouridine synthase 4, mitochondrial isoform X2 [Prunus dulcis]|uniref:RNA pseudouridine synthase 4, mitochondrial isoform X2 n=1 Tax=Prunus dulcis TaxID=3755 RepID=UPI001482447C|nr:RNA pseudouridine synthase 4, mitochondrial isoform X2 [Prunus dulcis]